MSRLPLPRLVLPRVLSLAQAAELGFTPDQVERRVRLGVWTRLAPSVYCTSPPHDGRNLLVAGTLHAAPHGVLTGAAALTAYGFAKLDPIERVTVLVPYREGIRSSPLIRVRRASHMPERVLVEGLALAPVPRAVIDHAMTLRRRDDVRAVLAQAVQRHRCRPHELGAEVEHVSRRGSKLVRASLQEITAGARSAAEARTAGALTAGGVVDFEQNISLADWGLAFRADFLWRSLRAVLEIDSLEFHYDDEAYDATLDRATVITARGFDTLHVAPRMVRRRPEVFVRRTRQWLLERATLLGVPPPFASL